MRLHICMLSAVALSAAMLLGTVAMAADLPKEGSYSGTYSGVGTGKAIAIGKERLLIAWDETGLSVAKESVRRLHEGLHSFLSIRRMEARRRKASALWSRFSQSLARRRQRPSQPMVRSTIQRLGRTTKPLT
jgi:hypothetical protein